MQDFKVIGGYSQEKSSGTFKGMMRVLDDGAVVGAMKDKHEGVIIPDMKFVLGIKDELKFNFWKFVMNPKSASFLYSMKSSSNGYEGKWTSWPTNGETILSHMGLAEKISKLNNIAMSGSTRFKKTLDVLSETDGNKIRNFISSHIGEYILENCKDRGYLTLERIV